MKKFNKPHYRIVSHFSDGSKSEVEEIYDLTNLEGQWVTSRRSFSKGLLLISSLLAALPLSGCAAKQKEMRIQTKDYRGVTVETKTLPCGSPIPPGAVCVCNCIPVTSPPSYQPRTYRTCTCVPVCTCNKICVCIPVV
ncbi:MAG: hypothetical protein QW404_03160 [Candidatus Nanoarchaeia archaeon]